MGKSREALVLVHGALALLSHTCMHSSAEASPAKLLKTGSPVLVASSMLRLSTLVLLCGSFVLLLLFS